MVSGSWKLTNHISHPRVYSQQTYLGNGNTKDSSQCIVYLPWSCRTVSSVHTNESFKYRNFFGAYSSPSSWKNSSIRSSPLWFQEISNPCSEHETKYSPGVTILTRSLSVCQQIFYSWIRKTSGTDGQELQYNTWSNQSSGPQIAEMKQCKHPSCLIMSETYNLFFAIKIFGELRYESKYK